MKLVILKTVDCNARMKLASPVTNRFGMVLFSEGEEMTDYIKEALLEMGIYHLEVLVSVSEEISGTYKVHCEK